MNSIIDLHSLYTLEDLLMALSLEAAEADPELAEPASDAADALECYLDARGGDCRG